MKERGFTLIELMIVVAIIAIIAAIAIPNLMRARLSANEASAIATLRTISSAEETFRSSGMQDFDGDGLGEYGTLAMLGATTGPLASPFVCSPGGTASPPFIDQQVASGNKSGYAFIVRTGNNALGALGGTTLLTTNGADAAEVVYDAFAIPVAYGRSGNRSFTIDAAGVIRQQDTGAQAAATISAVTTAGWTATSWPVVGG